MQRLLYSFTLSVIFLSACASPRVQIPKAPISPPYVAVDIAPMPAVRVFQLPKPTETADIDRALRVLVDIETKPAELAVNAPTLVQVARELARQAKDYAALADLARADLESANTQTGLLMDALLAAREALVKLGASRVASQEVVIALQGQVNLMAAILEKQAGSRSELWTALAGLATAMLAIVVK